MISKSMKNWLRTCFITLVGCVLLAELFYDLGLQGLSDSFQVFSGLSLTVLFFSLAAASDELRSSEKKQDTTEE